MSKLAKILATQLGCEYDKATRAIDRMRGRFQQRESKTCQKVMDTPSPGNRIVQSMLDSSEETQVFEAMIVMLEELLEDIDMDELEKAYNEEISKKVVN